MDEMLAILKDNPELAERYMDAQVELIRVQAQIAKEELRGRVAFADAEEARRELMTVDLANIKETAARNEAMDARMGGDRLGYELARDAERTKQIDAQTAMMERQAVALESIATSLLAQNKEKGLY